MTLGGPARLLIFCASIIGPNHLAAQGWTADVSAGATVHEGVAADVGTRSAMLGLRYQGPTWFYLTGGIPLDRDAVPWGAAGLGGRPALDGGRFDFGIDWTANGHLYRLPDINASGTGATLRGLPFGGLSVGPSRLEVYSGALQYRSSFEQGNARESETRTLHDSGIRAWVPLATSVDLAVEGRYLRGPEDDYPFLGGRMSYAVDRSSLWASAGWWEIESIRAGSWSVGASLSLGRNTSVYGSYGRESSDPIYWNQPWRSWTIGLSRGFGGGRSPVPPLPVQPPDSQGRITFSTPVAQSAEPPAVAGDFTAWKPVPMSREGDQWVARIRVESGLHHYVFIRADGSWFVPDSVATVDDGMGGRSAVLVVP